MVEQPRYSRGQQKLFLGGSHVGWMAIGASLFVENSSVNETVLKDNQRDLNLVLSGSLIVLLLWFVLSPFNGFTG